jgi:hypothetical protein
MAKAKQEKNNHRTQIVVALIGAGGVIVAAAVTFLGLVRSSKSEATAVYVTSVSTIDAGSSPGTQNLDSVTWKFTGTVKPPGGGKVFVLGTTTDDSQSVNSDPITIAFDGTWVAVVGPIPRDLAWKWSGGQLQ